jgi:hypothetical protein
MRVESEWWLKFTADHFDVLCAALPHYNLTTFGDEIFSKMHRIMMNRCELRENNIDCVEDHPCFKGRTMGLENPVIGYKISSKSPLNHRTKSSMRECQHRAKKKHKRTDWSTTDLWAWVKDTSHESDKEDTVTERYTPHQDYSEFVDSYQSNKERLMQIINKIIDGYIYLGFQGLPWHPLDWSCLLSVASNSVVYHELYQKLQYFDRLIKQQQKYYNKHWKRSLAQRKLDGESMDLPEYNLVEFGSRIWNTRDKNSTWDEDSLFWRSYFRMQPNPSSYYATKISNRHEEHANIVNNSSSEEDPFGNGANEEYVRQRVIDETDSSLSIIDDTTDIQGLLEHSFRVVETSSCPKNDDTTDIQDVMEHSIEGQGEEAEEPGATEEYVRQRIIDETDSSLSIIDDTTDVQGLLEHSFRVAETSSCPKNDDTTDIQGVMEHSIEGQGEEAEEPREGFSGLLRSVAERFPLWRRSTAPEEQRPPENCDDEKNSIRPVTNGSFIKNKPQMHYLNTDFDAFVIRSFCVGKMIETIIPSHIPIQLSGNSHNWHERRAYKNYLCIALTPFSIHIKKEYKKAILKKLNDLRGGPHPANSSDGSLLIHPISLSSMQFATIMTTVNVDMIII